MTGLRYILIGDSQGHKHLSKDGAEDLQLSGLYQWANAFKRYGGGGTIEPLWRKDDLEEYDIIHVNMTPSNLQHISWIRDQIGTETSIKVVCNIDLDVSQWSPNFSYYLMSTLKELKQADVLFHVESLGANILNHLTDRQVGVCPHPVDVSALYDCIKKEREPMIGTMFHRYTGETLIPFIAQKNIPLRKVLFGYTPIGKQAMVSNAGMYDQILMYQGYRSHIEELAKSAIGCDLYSGFTYGRSVVELAALGIPSVVSSTIEASHRLFPKTMVQPFDTRAAETAFEELVQNEEFTNDVIKNAHRECGYYSLENSHKRFVDMVENARP